MEEISATDLLLQSLQEGNKNGFFEAIREGADVNAPFGKFIINPLIFCAIENDVEYAGYLLDNGADIELGDGISGGSPLSWAAGRGNYDVAKFLLEQGANPNSKDDGGDTVFLTAVASNSPEMLDLLAAYGADIGQPNYEGFTPLHWAAFNRPAVLEWLLGNGANINATTDDGKTPLDIAKEEGFEEGYQRLSDFARR